MTSLCGVVDFKHGPMMPSAADHRGSQRTLSRLGSAGIPCMAAELEELERAAGIWDNDESEEEEDDEAHLCSVGVVDIKALETSCALAGGGSLPCTETAQDAVDVAPSSPSSCLETFSLPRGQTDTGQLRASRQAGVEPLATKSTPQRSWCKPVETQDTQACISPVSSQADTLAFEGHLLPDDVSDVLDGSLDFEAHQGIDLMHEVDSEVSAHVGLKVLPCGMEVAASAATEITAATCSLSAIATAAPAVKRQASGRGSATAVIGASSTVRAADQHSIEVQAVGAHSPSSTSADPVGSAGIPARVSRRLQAKRRRPDSADSDLQSSPLAESLPTVGSVMSIDSLQSHDSRKRNNSMRRPYSSVARGNHACTDCGTSVTPVWRAGPHGKSTLCNACGVRWSKVRSR